MMVIWITNNTNNAINNDDIGDSNNGINDRNLLLGMELSLCEAIVTYIICV